MHQVRLLGEGKKMLNSFVTTDAILFSIDPVLSRFLYISPEKNK